MQLHISASDGVPIYQQIANQIRYLVAAGRLQPGDELPPIRVLADQLTLNPNTVVRAYLELEHAGIVTKRHGTGTYVSETTTAATRRERMKILTQRADALLTDARQLNVELNDLIKLLRQRNCAMSEVTA